MKGKKFAWLIALLVLCVSAQATMPLRFVIEDAKLSKEIVKPGEEFEATVSVRQAAFGEAKGIGVGMSGPVEGSFAPEAVDFTDDEVKVFKGLFKVKEGTAGGRLELEIEVREGPGTRTRQSIYITVVGEEPCAPADATPATAAPDWLFPVLAGFALALGLWSLFGFVKGRH